MRQPSLVKKVHNPEVAARRGKSKSAWFKRGSPTALKEIERIRNLNPMADPKVRKKVSKTLRMIGHQPKERGGNGRPLTLAQRTLFEVLTPTPVPEYAVSLGPKKPGYPTCYKLDLAWPDRKFSIEVDGVSHKTLKGKERDRKKSTKVSGLGWTVFHFTNKEILNWSAIGKPTDSFISMTLKSYGIHPLP
jgi:transposase InsO family protein